MTDWIWKRSVLSVGLSEALASVQIAKDDKRVKAVVDCDGQLFGDVPESGIDRPVMMMHGELKAASGSK